MAIKKCPYCAEEIQEEALLCKHCKSNLSTAPVYQPVQPPVQLTAPPPLLLPVIPQPSQSNQILEVMNISVRWRGRTVLFCTPEALVIKEMGSTTVKWIMWILIVLVPFFWIVAVIYFLIEMVVINNKLKVWEQMSQYIGPIKSAKDLVIRLDSLQQVRIKSGMMLVKVTLLYAYGKKIIYLNKKDASRFRQLYPALAGGSSQASANR